MTNIKLPDLKDVEGLLTFEPAQGESPYLLSHPQRPFKPRGLMLWDVGTLQVEATLGTNLELVASFGKVPARWFTVSASFEQVAKAIAEGKEPGRDWGEWSEVYPGMRITLHFDGPASQVQALMWGHVCR